MYANSVNKRLPMSPDLARDILMLHYVPGRAWDGLSILELRFVAFFLVLYFACARYKEAARIKMENIRVTNSGNVMILFYKAKNNQFGYQRAAYILLSGHKYLCPVLILRTYLEKQEVLDSCLPLLMVKVIFCLIRHSLMIMPSISSRMLW